VGAESDEWSRSGQSSAHDACLISQGDRAISPPGLSNRGILAIEFDTTIEQSDQTASVAGGPAWPGLAHLSLTVSDPRPDSCNRLIGHRVKD
jgi:hypothetical protein